MLSRLFQISTILLIGITTVSIGAPVAETTEIINAVNLPQMGSGNHTMNRRFILGIPGLPQCPDPGFPNLVYSECLTPKLIGAVCDFRGNLHGPKEERIPCPDKTTCMEFKALKRSSVPNSKFLNFAICIEDESVGQFGNDKKKGIYCKDYKINGVSGDTATLSIDIYDGSQKPALVKGVSFTVGSQSGGKQNTNSFSTIVNNIFNGENIKVCTDIVNVGFTLYTMFTMLDGTYSYVP